MTIYKVLNLTNNVTEYIVESQEAVDANDHLTCSVGTESDAATKHDQYVAAYMTQESYRFTIAKEIVNGNNTTWVNVENINEDLHDGGYFVFNTLTGMHEKAANKEEAIAIQNRIKQEFIDYSDLTSYKIVESLPSKTSIAAGNIARSANAIPVVSM